MHITTNFANAEDVLAFAGLGNITGSYNAATGELTLSGTDTVANYQAALRLVTYENTSDNPSTLQRTLSWSVNDGTDDSNISQMDLSVEAVNDAPVIYGLPSLGLKAVEGVVLPFNDGHGVLKVADVDLGANNIEVALTVTNGALSLSDLTNITINSGANNSASITLQGTLTDINNSLASLSYKSNMGFSGTDSLSVNVDDLGGSGTGGALQANTNFVIEVEAVADLSIVELTYDDGLSDDKNFVTLMQKNSATIASGTKLYVNITEASPQGTVAAEYNGVNWIAIDSKVIVNTIQSQTAADYSTIVLDMDDLLLNDTAAIALVSADEKVLELLSYEGNIVFELNGDEFLSTDIGVINDNNSVSLQKQINGQWQVNDVGSYYNDRGALPAGFGQNQLALADPATANAFISTVLYDPADGSSNDNFVSIAYKPYTTDTQAGAGDLRLYINAEDGTTGTLVLEYINGVWSSPTSASFTVVNYASEGYDVISIGSGDYLNDNSRGIALADGNDNVIDFISYESQITSSYNSVTYDAMVIGAQENENYIFIRDLQNRFTPFFDLDDSLGNVENGYRNYLPLNLIYPQTETHFKTSDLFISKFAYDDWSVDNKEFIELIYRDNGVAEGTTLTININPHESDEAVVATFTSGSWVAANGYEVVTPPANSNVSYGGLNAIAFTATTNSWLKNYPAALTLTDASNNVIEFLSYEGEFVRTFNNGTFASRNIGIYHEGDTSGVLKRQLDDEWARNTESDARDSKGILELGLSNPPQGQNNTITTLEDVAYVFGLNDFGYSDADNHPFTAIKVETLPADGTLKLDGVNVVVNQYISVQAITDGDLSFVADGDESGVAYASFNFFVNDGLVDSETSYTMTIDVTAVNDAPVAQDGVVSTNEDTTHIFSLNEFGFSDVDTGDTLQSITVVYSSISGNGQLKYNGTAITADQVVLAANIGLLSYEPDGENAEVASFDFLVNDGTVDSDAPATMTINVTAINDIPVAQASSVTTNEDTTHVFSLNEFGFSDVDIGDTLQSITVVFSSISANGQLKYNGTTITADQVVLAANIGLLSYEPDAEDAETASFDFLVSDGVVDSANQATMTINVTAVNDPPIAINSAITTNEDSNYTFNLSDFDFTDVENDTLSSVTITSLPANGMLKVNGSAVVLGTNNTVTLAQLVAGELVFEPVADEHGAPYTSFNFSVNDGVDNSNAATMTIDVTPINDAPTLTNFADAIVSTNEDTEVEISLAQLLAQGNEADIDGTVDGFVVQTLTSGTLKIGATQATATAFAAGTNDTIDATNKAYWTPAPNVNGNAIAAFTVKAQDNEGLLSATAVQATVDVVAVNDAPVAANSAITTNEDTNHTFSAANFSFTDVENDALSSVTITSLPANGTLKVNGSAVVLGTNNTVTLAQLVAGELVFEPVADEHGASYTSFNFTVNDGVDNSNVATMTIDVTSVNDAPTLTSFADAIVSTNEDTEVEITLAQLLEQGDEADIDGTIDGFVVQALTSGTLKIGITQATATAFAAGTNDTIDATNKAYWTPAPNVNGDTIAAFTVKAQDNEGLLSSTAVQATVDVVAVNDAPVAANSAITTNEDTNHTFSAANFSFTDVENDALTSVTITSLPANGMLTVNSSAVILGTNNTISLAQLTAGELVFEPVADENGASYASFNFSVNDGVDNSNIATMTIDVTSINDAPTLTSFADAIVSTNEDTEVEITLAQLLAQGNEADIDGTVDGFVVQALTSGTLKIGATQGAATAFSAGTNDTIDASNNAYWTPAPNANGDTIAAFTVKAQDNEGLLSATAIQATVDVVAVNDEPVVTATGLNPSFTENQTAVSLFAGTAIDLVETADLVEAITFTVSNLVDGNSEQVIIDGENINLVDGSGTTAANSYNYTVAVVASTATVTITHASDIDVTTAQSLIDSLQYINNSDNLVDGTRVVTLTALRDSGSVANGGDNEVTLSIASTVNVTAINDEPIVTATGLNPSFSENQAAVSLFGSTAIDLIESADLVEAITFTVSNLVDGNSEQVIIDGQSISLVNGSGTTTANSYNYNIAVVANTATVTITHASDIDVTTAQSLIDSLQYINSSDNLVDGTR
ncbi:Ig-like domain-containing protein, partial [Cysteiniphilum marinum]